MKIGILTFHCADNYGAVLQTYGLQEYLKSLGHEVYVIDYRPQYLLKPYRIFEWKRSPVQSAFRNLLLFFRAIWASPIRLKRKKEFSKFRHNWINLLSADCLGKDSNFDAFVFGSDQIWNPIITKGLDRVYLGQFPAAKGKKNIVYAASAGSSENLVSCISELQTFIPRFHAVSVREKSLSDYLQPRVGNPIPVVLDPVLLVGRNVYTQLLSRKKKRKPYMLCFQLLYNEKLSQIAEKVAREKKLDLVELASFESFMRREQLVTQSPENFLSLFYNADYIITSSFHGTVFAILFEKDFNTISFDDKKSERMSNLLSSLGLSDRLVFNGQKPVTENIDYASVNTKLSALRIASQAFIKNALN